MEIDRLQEQYFIDLQGNVHKYTLKEGEDIEEIYSIHLHIAEDLFPNVHNPDDYVCRLGWITIGSSVYSTPVCEKEPTQAQINTMFTLGLLNRLCVLNPTDNCYHKFISQ
jgi:hypothetical protein